MHAFEVLGDPVRRRILELLADGEHTAGAITATIRAEFGISQPAVSQQLRVLRENGFAVARADAQHRDLRATFALNGRTAVDLELSHRAATEWDRRCG